MEESTTKNQLRAALRRVVENYYPLPVEATKSLRVALKQTKMAIVRLSVRVAPKAIGGKRIVLVTRFI